MKSFVYQSYRTTNVPRWISRCLLSVKSWAARNGFEYQFIDDRFFSYTPEWYREKVNNNILLVTDLARLLYAKQLLASGFDRTIWVDADVIVFNENQFSIDTKWEYAFCHEVWLRRQEISGVQLPIIRRDEKVNNSITVFTKTSPMLQFHIDTLLKHIADKPVEKISSADAATWILTKMHQRTYLPLLRNVGLFSPLILSDLATGEVKHIKKYMKKVGNPIFAANLVHSGFGGRWMRIHLTEDLYGAAIENLTATHGEIVNRYSVSES